MIHTEMEQLGGKLLKIRVEYNSDSRNKKFYENI